MATTIPQGDYGIASVQNDAYQDIELFAGDTPAVVTVSGTVGADLLTAMDGAALPAWSPVHITATGEVVPSELVQDTTTPLNAITVFPVAADAAEGAAISVYQAGMFNIRAINWAFYLGQSFADSLGEGIYDSVRGAFAETTGHQIYLKAPYYHQ